MITSFSFDLFQSLHEAIFVPYEIRAPNVKHTETGSLSPVYLSA